MKVEIDGRTFTVVFIKEKDKHNDGTEKINTVCKILEGETLFGYGEAKLNYRDKYHKVVGKKIALQRALESESTFMSGLYTEECKKIRTAFWAAFKNEFGKTSSLLPWEKELYNEFNINRLYRLVSHMDVHLAGHRDENCTVPNKNVLELVRLAYGAIFHLTCQKG